MKFAWSIADRVSGGRVRTRIATSSAKIFLTFDDGPHPVHTVELLELLSSFDARCTFFLVGDNAERYPEIVRAIVARGHRIGNHSYAHPNWRTIPSARRRDEIARTDSILASFDGHTTHEFRPPRGEIPLSVLLACLLRRDRLTLWSRDSLDYKLTAPQVVAHLGARAPVAGEVLLFHDDQPVAREALCVLLPAWRALGIDFCALPE